MGSVYINILTSFIAGTACSAVLLPVILKIAVKRKLYDKIDSRKNHRGNVPRLGGMAFLPSLMLGMLCSLGLDFLLGCICRRRGADNVLFHSPVPHLRQRRG